MRERSLRRGTDRIEDAAAWLLTVAGMAVLIVAWMLGVSAYAQGTERVRSERADRAQATAVLLQEAPQLTGEHGMTDPFVRLPAQWTDSAGRQHEGEVTVRSSRPAGTQVRVWIDLDGQLAPPPADRLTAVLDGALTAIVVVTLGGGLIVSAWIGLRRAIFAHNARNWEREWARIGPEWNPRQPT